MHVVPPCFVARQRTHGLDNGSNRCSYFRFSSLSEGISTHRFAFTWHEVSGRWGRRGFFNDYLYYKAIRLNTLTRLGKFFST
jgi:hypothetical protein